MIIRGCKYKYYIVNVNIWLNISSNDPLGLENAKWYDFGFTKILGHISMFVFSSGFMFDELVNFINNLNSASY